MDLTHKDAPKCERLVAIFLLAVSLSAQTVGPEDRRVTAVQGVSWLSHLHRTFNETSMGRTGHLGPPPPLPGQSLHRWQPKPSTGFARPLLVFDGADLFRINCQGCHRDSGLGAPPEINSVIDPVRATSVALIRERMKKAHQDMSAADIAELAKQSKTLLLQRLRNGGDNMPPPILSELEIGSVFAYLEQLSGVPSAEKRQIAVKESASRLGEQIVKANCHTCHNATGANPDPQQLLDGAIPPLSTLTARVNQTEFIRKVVDGAPIAMGMPPMSYRGRMPVFVHLSEEEVSAAYQYLVLYPPVPNPMSWTGYNPAKTPEPRLESSSPAIVREPAEHSPAALPRRAPLPSSHPRPASSEKPTETIVTQARSSRWGDRLRR